MKLFVKPPLNITWVPSEAHNPSHPLSHQLVAYGLRLWPTGNFGLAEGLASRGGAVVNVSSVAGLTNFPRFPTYSASKAAIHSLTQGARALLARRGVTVFGVYPGPVDTDMAREITLEKASPEAVAKAVLDGIEAGTEDIFPDPFAVTFGEQYQASPKEPERQAAAMVAA